MARFDLKGRSTWAALFPNRKLGEVAWCATSWRCRLGLHLWARISPSYEMCQRRNCFAKRKR